MKKILTSRAALYVYIFFFIPLLITSTECINETIVYFQTWDTEQGTISAIYTAILLVLLLYPMIYYIINWKTMQEKYSMRDYVEMIIVDSSIYFLFLTFVPFAFFCEKTGLLDTDEYLFFCIQMKLIGVVLAIVGSLLVIKRLKQKS